MGKGTLHLTLGNILYFDKIIYLHLPQDVLHYGP